MRRLSVLAAGLALSVGALGFAVAQDATPVPVEELCPAGATPLAVPLASPVTSAGSPVASPAAAIVCATPEGATPTP